jgi:hypothetical protein
MNGAGTVEIVEGFPLQFELGDIKGIHLDGSLLSIGFNPFVRRLSSFRHVV